jgi:hypothetical protein
MAKTERTGRLLGLYGVVLFAGAGLLSSGCETGRTNKVHAEWQHLSDATTTSKPESTQKLEAGENQPPVPGSPTAAGPDGNQPLNDSEALTRHGSEHEATPPNRQPADSPERR